MGTATTLPTGEQRVLLRSTDAGVGEAELAGLLRGVDWDALLALAARERAAADLHRRVRSLTDVVPPAAMVVLRRMALISDFEMRHAEQCLDEVLRVAESLGIRVMLLKGAAVAHTVYGGELRHRPMSDLDLLVDAASAPVLQRALLGDGRWRSEREGSDDVYHAHHHLPPLRDGRGSALVLELHTGLFPAGTPLGLTPAMLWSCAIPVQPRASAPIGDVYVPTVTHQMLHVCLHFAWSHAMKFGTWRAFRDVAALAAMPNVDWDAIVRLARETRAVTSCYWTFRLARAAAHAPVPDAVCAALRPPRPESYLCRLERHYLLNLFPASQVCPSVRLDRVLWDLGMLPRWSGHGEARPWDHDARFVAAAGAAAMPRRARVRSLWQATRYLGAVMARPAGARVAAR